MRNDGKHMNTLPIPHFFFSKTEIILCDAMSNYMKIVVAMLIWSTWGMMIRWISLPPVVVLFYTAFTASIAVPLVLKVRGEFSLTGVSAVWPLFCALAFSSIINNLTYFYALAHTTVSNAVFTHYTAPVFVAVLAPFLLAERLQPVTLISLPLAVSGMVLIVLAKNGIQLGEEHRWGIIAGSASGVAYAFLIIVSRKLSQSLMHHKAVVVLLWITTAVTAPAAFIIDHQLTTRTVFLLVTGGLAHSTIAPLLYFSALRQVMAQHAAILGYIEPLAAIPLAFMFLSEFPPLSAMFGGFLILFSGYFVVRASAGNRHSL
jgi:drug/metabolite transporter (DMT)-like permease